MILTTSISFGESYERGNLTKRLKITKATIDEEDITHHENFLVKILSGKDKGKLKKISHPIFKNKAYNIILNKGDNVVLYFDDNDNKYYIFERDRKTQLITLTVVFIGIIIAAAGFNGVRALISLIATILLLINLYIPLVIKGYSPILMAVVIAVISSIITVLAIGGRSKKSIIAILGTSIGVIAAGVLSMIFSKWMGLTGYIDVERVNFAYLLKNIDLKQLVISGIIIGSLGAVMDIAVSIASTLTELVKANPNYTQKQLLAAGMNVGRDVIGTMINTLILAYAGGSLFLILILTIQHQEFPLVRILNGENIVVEILRSIAGSIGILLAVPITSLIGSIMLVGSEKKVEAD